jgi:UDP-glucose 4-epimerase
VSDLADAHIRALHILLENGTSNYFNLGTGKGHSVLEVIHAAESVVGKKIPYEIHPRREGDPPELVAANAKALSTLGWNPKITSIEEIIASAWKWHQTL